MVLLNPRREEENLEVARAKIRATTRMRLGIVAGVLIIGIFQTKLPGLSGDGVAADAQELLRTAMPLVFLAVAGVLVVLGLARRDLRRVEAAYDAKRFRVPKRKKPSDKP